MAIGEMHHYWWKELKIPANWKNAQEALMEAYNVSATHPQLYKLGREIVFGESLGLDVDLNHRIVDYEASANGISRPYSDRSHNSGRIQKTVRATTDTLTAVTTNSI